MYLTFVIRHEILRQRPKAHATVVFDHRAELFGFRYVLYRHDGANYTISLELRNVNCGQLTSGGALCQTVSERGQEGGVTRKAFQRRKGGHCMVGDAALGLFRGEFHIAI